MRFLSVICACLLLSSCATVFNRRHYQINFQSNREDTKIIVNDSTYQLPARVKVKRQRKELPVVVKLSDSVSKTVTLYPVADKKMWLNLVTTVYSPPLFVIDYLNPRHFTYGKRVSFLIEGDSLQAKNSSRRALYGRGSQRFSRYLKQQFPTQAGRINLTVGVPQVSHLLLDNAFHYGDSWNVAGFKTGVEYFHKDNRYLSLQFAYIFPSSDDFVLGETFGPEDFERHSAFYVSLTDNFRYRRLSFGYGLNYTRSQSYIQREVNYDLHRTFVNHMVGLNADVSFQLSRFWFVSFNYKPDFYRFSPKSDWRYEHLMSLEFIAKFGVRKARR